MSDRASSPPSYIRGRKGAVSVVDAVVAALWRAHDGKDWPTRSLAELRAAVSATLGYAVAASTVRASVYDHPELFEKDPRGDAPRYRLTAKVRKRVGALAAESGVRP